MYHQDTVLDALCEEKIRKGVRKVMKEDAKQDELMKNVHQIFQYIDDSDCEFLLESVLYFVEKHEFDIKHLPEGIYKRVVEHLTREAIESHAESNAELLRPFTAGMDILGYGA